MSRAKTTRITLSDDLTETENKTLCCGNPFDMYAEKFVLGEQEKQKGSFSGKSFLGEVSNSASIEFPKFVNIRNQHAIP